ncbi:hypothetical protein OG552_29890 [Streptomyces sp. NBC_01476]|uniref:hypothetical protein n=1 Tax=Streptomyces sp. NBC_01476 TaxID=2903881 RepID=UPI002E2FCDA9|nr:hypothetical protein [Streptomyces sp. NBC_01476]
MRMRLDSSAMSGARAGLRVRPLGHALLVHRKGDPDPEVVAFTRALAPDPQHQLVVVDLPPGADRREWEAVPKALPGGPNGVRIVFSRAVPPQVRAFGQAAADRLGCTVLAPDGAVRTVPGGGLFVPHDAGAGWLRHRPKRAAAYDSRRFPKPAWEYAVADRPWSTAAHAVVEPTASGIWLRGHPADPDGGKPWLVDRVAGSVDVLTAVLGSPGGPPVELPDALRVWHSVLPSARRWVRFLQLGPVTLPAGVDSLGQGLADGTGDQVVFYTGLPALPPVAGQAQYVEVPNHDGTAAWRPFAGEVVYFPAAGGTPPPPALLGVRSPVTGAAEETGRVFAYGHGTVLEVVQSGLWLRPPAEPAGGDGVRRVTAAPGRAVILYDRSTPATGDLLRGLAEDMLRQLDPTLRDAFRVAPADAPGVALGWSDPQWWSPAPAAVPPPAHGHLDETGMPRAGGRTQPTQVPTDAARLAPAQPPYVRLAEAQGPPPEHPGPDQAGPPQTDTSPTLTANGSDQPGTSASGPDPGPPHPTPAGRAGPPAPVPAHTPPPAEPYVRPAPPDHDPRHPPGKTPVPAPDSAPPPAPPQGAGSGTPGPSPARLPRLTETAAPFEPLPAANPAAPAAPTAPTAPGADRSAPTAGPQQPAGIDAPAAPVPPRIPGAATERTAETPTPTTTAAGTAPSPPPGTAAPRTAPGTPAAGTPAAPALPIGIRLESLDSPTPTAPPGGQRTPPAEAAPSAHPGRPAQGAPALPQAQGDPHPAGSGAHHPAGDTGVRVQPVPSAGATAVPSGRGLDKERAWLRKTFSNQFGALAGSVSRVMSESPGLRSGSREEGADTLTDLVAVRLYLGGDHAQVDAAVRSATAGPHIPLARCVASGLRRLPSYRGAALLHAPATPAELGWYREGRVATEWTFCSASTVPYRVPEDDVLFLVWSMTARRTRLLDPGRPDRVVFEPGTRFRVLRAEPGAPAAVLLRELSASEPEQSVPPTADGEGTDDADARARGGPAALNALALADLEKSFAALRGGGKAPEGEPPPPGAPPGLLPPPARAPARPAASPGSTSSGTSSSTSNSKGARR